MMKLIVNSFRGIQEADIQLGSITLIAGPNAQGKTSLLQGAIATVCETIPIDGIEKKHVTLLVKSGNAEAEAEFTSNTGSVKVTYPDAQRSTTGSPLEITRMAAGMESFVDYSKPADRSRAFCELLQAYPSPGEITVELEKIGAAASAQKIIDTIKVHGWDTAHKNAQQAGAQLKGAWSQITGEDYGSKKAESWSHPDWEIDLAEAKEPDLVQAVNDLNDLYIAAQSDKSVTESEAQRLQKLADQVPQLNTEITSLSNQLNALFKNEQDIRSAAGKLPPAEQPKSCKCPHCKKNVQIDNGKLSAVQLLTDEEISKRKSAIDSANESLQNVKTEIQRINTDLAAKRADLETAKNAGAELSKKQKRRKSTENVADAVEECKKQLETAQKRLNAFQKTKSAESKHKLILANQKIVDMLAPAGLRQVKLIQVLGQYNSTLQQICKIAGWRTVEVKANMLISLGGTVYALCSKAEKYSVRVALQLAAAMIAQSGLVIIDDSDDLLGTMRNGLFKALLTVKIPALIALATEAREKLPNLSKFGGVCYWIENGVANKV